MPRTWLLLLFGLAGGALAHFAWYHGHRPSVANTASDHLAWMQSELSLTEAQFARIKVLHEASGPHLLTLASQVAQLRAELARFESERRTAGSVDFLEFARWVDNRKAVDLECTASTRRLVLATADVMTEEQRMRYIGLLGPVLGPTTGIP